MAVSKTPTSWRSRIETAWPEGLEDTDLVPAVLSAGSIMAQNKASSNRQMMTDARPLVITIMKMTSMPPRIQR